jgi:DNA polymerase III sliding clamp (beta) subunit (PCNA family)
MSARGESVKKKVSAMINKYENDEAFVPFREVLEMIRDLNDRIQELEREVGYSDSFVDPKDANNRIST